MKRQIKGYGVMEQLVNNGNAVFYPVLVVEETHGFLKPVTEINYEPIGSRVGFVTKEGAEEYIREFLKPEEVPTTVFHPYSSCDVYAPGEGPCNKK